MEKMTDRNPAGELSNNEIAEMRGVLSDHRQALLDRSQATQEEAMKDWTQEQTGEISKVRLHPADLASREAEDEVLRQLTERELRQLQEIEAALERLDRG